MKSIKGRKVNKYNKVKHPLRNSMVVLLMTIIVFGFLMVDLSYKVNSYSINRSYEGMLFDDFENNLMVEKTIEIKGLLKDPLLSDSKFRGIFVIEGKSYPVEFSYRSDESVDIASKGIFICELTADINFENVAIRYRMAKENMKLMKPGYHMDGDFMWVIFVVSGYNK